MFQSTHSSGRLLYYIKTNKKFITNNEIKKKKTSKLTIFWMYKLNQIFYECYQPLVASVKTHDYIYFEQMIFLKLISFNLQKS